MGGGGLVPDTPPQRVFVGHAPLTMKGALSVYISQAQARQNRPTSRGQTRGQAAKKRRRRRSACRLCEKNVPGAPPGGGHGRLHGSSQIFARSRAIFFEDRGNLREAFTNLGYT